MCCTLALIAMLSSAVVDPSSTPRLRSAGYPGSIAWIHRVSTFSSSASATLSATARIFAPKVARTTERSYSFVSRVSFALPVPNPTAPRPMTNPITSSSSLWSVSGNLLREALASIGERPKRMPDDEEAARQRGDLLFRENSSDGGKAI